MVEEAASLEIPVEIPAIEIVSDIGQLHALDTEKEERVTRATVFPGEVSHYSFKFGTEEVFFVLIGDPDGGGAVFLVTGPDGKEPVESLFPIAPGKKVEVMPNAYALGVDLIGYRKFGGRRLN